MKRYNIIINDPDPANAGRSQVLQGWAAQSAGTNYHDTCLQQFLLPLFAKTGEKHLPLVTFV